MKSRQKWIFTLILFSPLFIFANPKFITVFESNTSDLAINWIYNPVNPMEPVGLFQGKVQFKDLNINIEKKTVLLKSYGNNWNLTEINGNEKTKILKAKWYNFSGDLIGNLKMDWGFDSPLPEFILPENEDNIIYFDLFNSFKIFNKTIWNCFRKFGTSYYD